MAKNPSSNSTPSNPSNPASTPTVSFTPASLPAGYQIQTEEIVGTWNSDREPTFHFMPLEVKVFDSQLDAKKPSHLIVGILVDASPLDKMGKDTEEVVMGKPGDRVGVWAKPGMADLRKLAGQKTFIWLAGEKDTGKPNPMKVYKCASVVQGQPLLITEDLRKESKHAKTIFDIRTSATPPVNGGRQPSDESGEVPFA